VSLNAEDRGIITDLINRYGHLVDTGQFDRMHEILTEDVVYDVTDLDGGVLVGLEALRQAALTVGDGNPLAHHVTNIVLDEATGDLVHALSKGLGVMADGGIGSVTYEDRIERRDRGWRIAQRTVRSRRSPLRP
jgi:hypothetical protein